MPEGVFIINIKNPNAPYSSVKANTMAVRFTL